MELRQLGYFVAVAEEGHFRRAAARLHLSTSGLSQQIRALETHLRVELIIRAPTGARLTPAGQELLTRARELLHAADVAVAAARAAQTQRLSGRLSLLLDADAAPRLDESSNDFARLHPDVDLRVEIVGERLLRERVARSRDWHLAVCWTPLPDTRHRSVAQVPVRALVRSDHPLLRRFPHGAIPQDALRDWPITMFDSNEAPYLHDSILRAVARPAATVSTAGPVHGALVPVMARRLRAADGHLVALVPAVSPPCGVTRGLVARDLSPRPMVSLYANMPASARHPAVEAFVAELRRRETVAFVGDAPVAVAS